MRSRQILLFSLLFSILAGSLFYYVFSWNREPLRRDPVPSGAHVVPWMQPNPSMESLCAYSEDSQPWDIDAAMADALKLNITFTINVLNETRVVQSTVFLGHDSHYLYVGGEFRGMYRNPTDTSDTGAFPNIFTILFDVNNDGQLTFPEAGSIFGAAIFENASLHFNQVVWSSDDLLWCIIPQSGAPFRWTSGGEFYSYSTTVQPASAVRDMAEEYDNATGTLTILFSRYLWIPSDSLANAFQMRLGERWVTGFLLMLGYANRYIILENCIAAWPEDYSYMSNDSSWWPKLAIDLSNPPTTYLEA